MKQAPFFYKTLVDLTNKSFIIKSVSIKQREKKMIKNRPQIIRTVKIRSMHKKGYGQGDTDTGGQMIVPFTIPGETVQALKRGTREGRLHQLIEPSKSRIEPICPHFTHCGGCVWQHIEYPHQLELKQTRIKNLFVHHKIAVESMDFPIEDSNPLEYRNRMDFVWWFDGGFGLRRRGAWFAMEQLTECHLLPKWVMDIAFEINRRVQKAGLAFRDQRMKTPGLRYLVLRLGVFTGELMVCIVSDPMEIPPEIYLGLDRVTSVYQMVKISLENDLSEGEPVHLWGKTTYRETILGHDYEAGPCSFFQPNPAVAEKMVQYIQTILADSPAAPKNLLDLYCGLGLFSIALSNSVDSVLGIELVEEAVTLAQQNAQGTKARFVCMEAEKITPDMLDPYNILIVDPPRIGLPPYVKEMIKQAAFEQIIYVSCNPTRGVDDIEKLTDMYDVQSVKLFDQFPQTQHVEMIVHLKRKKQRQND